MIMRMIDSDEIRIKPEYMYDICGSVMIRVEDITRIINDMPTIKPQKWIPCSERLPEVGQNVLLSSGNGMFTVEGWLKNDGDWYQFRWNKIWSSDYIDAWMPLPEPYEENKE